MVIRPVRQKQVLLGCLSLHQHMIELLLNGSRFSVFFLEKKRNHYMASSPRHFLGTIGRVQDRKGLELFAKLLEMKKAFLTVTLLFSTSVYGHTIFQVSLGVILTPFEMNESHPSDPSKCM